MKQLEIVFPIDYDNEGSPMLPAIQAPTFATPKDAFAYFTRHLQGQPCDVDLSDDDDAPSDIFDVLEREDAFDLPTTGDASSEQGPDNATDEPSAVDDEGAEVTEEETQEGA